MSVPNRKLMGIKSLVIVSVYDILLPMFEIFIPNEISEFFPAILVFLV